MLLKNSLITLALFILTFLNTPVVSQDIYNMEHIARYSINWNDGVYDVAEQGDNYYLACGSDGFRVAGFMYRLEPVLDDISQYPCHDARAVAVSGNYAYVGTLQDGMLIIDVTYPRSPSLAHQVMVDASLRFSAIKISGNYAFLCCSPGGVFIVNITDPRHPIIVSNIPNITDVRDIELRDTLAFLACANLGLLMYNFANLENPQLLGSYVCGDSDGVNGVDVSGNYAFLACDGTGFRVIDLNSMQMVAGIDSVADGNRVHLDQNYAYITYGDLSRRLAIIDISNPLSPQVLGIYQSNGSMHNFVFGQWSIVAANDRRGLSFIYAIDPSNPYTAMNFNNYARYFDVIVSSNALLVQDEFQVKGFDISSPEDPWLRALLALPREYNSLRVVGNLGYIAQDGDTALILLYIGDYGYPNINSEFIEHDCGFHSDVAIYGDYAYLIQPNGIRIINASNHDSLWQAGFYSYPLTSSKAIVFGHYLYVQDNNLNLLRLDLSNPLNPTINCQYPLSQSCRNLKAVSTKLFVVTDQKLWIFDTTPLDSLQLISETTIITEPGASLHGLDYKRDHLFVTGDIIGLNVYYIGDPALPVCTGYSRISDRAMGITLTGNIAIVANYSNLDFYDCSVAADIDRPESVLPDRFALLPNYPNPFNSSTQVRFELAQSEYVSLQVFDLLGRKVATLADNFFAPGYHSINWDGSTNDGNIAYSGVYFIRANCGNQSRIIKVLLLK